MKLTKIALILVVPALVLILMGQNMQTPKAEAKVTSIITLNPSLCIALSISLDWNGDGIADAADGPLALANCSSLDGATSLAALVTALGGDPANPKPSDFASLDMDGGQMHQLDGTLFILAFVSNDEPVGFYADVGVFPSSGGAFFECGPGVDEDCNNNGVRGDGVAVARLTAIGAGLTNADRGPAEVRIRQGMLEQAEDYTVVGEPHTIAIKAYKEVIQVGPDVCVLFSDTATFLDALQSPETAPLLFSVFDDDGTAVSGAFVEVTISNPDGATVALPLSPTLDLSASLGSTGGPDLICGLDEPGQITLTAGIVKGPEGVDLDPNARLRDAEIDITVRDVPTELALSASPASLVCDGTVTSTVSAALTDDEDNPAVDGNRVRFSVRALGTVSPLLGKSAGGAATTTLTPLSDILRGVTVDAILLLPTLDVDYDDLTEADIANCEAGTQTSPCPVKTKVLEPEIEKTFLVECSTVPGVAPQPSAPSAPSISPPSTGDGGYLGQ